MIGIFRTLCVLGTLLVVTTASYAGSTGLYAGVYGGVNLVPSTRSTDDKGSFDLTFTPAPQWGAVFGMELGPGNVLSGEGRVELEYARRSNPLDKVKLVEGSFSGGGDLTVDSLLLSSYYVYRNRNSWMPYIGVGAGVARISADGLTVTGQPLSNDSDIVFAYQIGTGIDVPLTKKLTLDLGYRFFGCSQPKLAESNGSTLKVDYFTHSALLGVRYLF